MITMLSRVADALYWMSRYLERAEHTARLLDVNLHQSLDQRPEVARQRWRDMLNAMKVTTTIDLDDTFAIADYLTFNQSQPASIVSCVSAAREHASQMRELISTEMWEHLNRLYLRVRDTSLDLIWNTNLHEFYYGIRAGSHIFQGVTDATLMRNESWQFIQVGRFLERADQTATLLDAYYSPWAASERDNGTPLDYLLWVRVLKSCSAFEAYCKVYTAEMQPDHIVEFVLLNSEFPRSVRFAVNSMRAALGVINQAVDRKQAHTVERLAGKLQSMLQYAHIADILESDLSGYLKAIRDLCRQIDIELYQTYVGYAIETALPV